MYLGYLVSWLHPILVHFPIALLVGACFVEIFGWRFRWSPLSNAAKWMLAAGCVMSLFTFVSGNFSEVFSVRGGTPHDPVDLHANWAMYTTWTFILLTVARFYLEPDRHPAWFKVYLMALLAATGMLAYTGHQGGMLVYEYGANVKSHHMEHALDMKDLRDLYQEQTYESLVYSEMMHHVFGWLVLAMSLFMILSKFWPEQTQKLWKGGPYALLAGGVFLMIFSDNDSWPLSDARPIYDKEVLQHKIFATLMLLAGGISLMRRGRKADAPSAGYHQGLALLALVGGGLLFTHIHSVAPYSNRAVGVYLHHLVMGFFAVCAGAVSLWESIKPEGARWRAYLWPSILVIESILLINYNENIPWFVRAFTRENSVMVSDSQYALRLNSDPVIPVEKKPVRLMFRLDDVVTGKGVPELEIVHEKPLHLMIVSKDLSFFDHVHPEPKGDGTLVLDYSFPHGGEFILFSDLMPKGGKQLSFRIPIQVQGNVPAPQKITETVYETVRVGNRDVLLFTKPYLPSEGQPAWLRFGLFEKEKGITDLELFMGCFGHCIIISEDTQFYLHTHPEGHQHGVTQKALADLEEPIPNADSLLPNLGIDHGMMFTMGMNSPSMKYSGPEVVFPAVFPRSGLYKVWGQFLHHGEVVTAPFVVRVP